MFATQVQHEMTISSEDQTMDYGQGGGAGGWALAILSAPNLKMKVVNLLDATSKIKKYALEIINNKTYNKIANNLIDKYIKGLSVDKKHLFNDVFELRNLGEGIRVYYRIVDGKFYLIGLSNKNTQSKVINALRSLYE